MRRLAPCGDGIMDVAAAESVGEALDLSAESEASTL